MSGTPSYIQPVGVHSKYVCGPTALLIDLQERLLINCGESLQRLATEWRLKVSKVGNVIVTHIHPEFIGGLIGLLLTLEGIEAPTYDVTNKKALQALTRKVSLKDYYNSEARFGSMYVDYRWRRKEVLAVDLNPLSTAAGSYTLWWRPVFPKADGGSNQSYEDYVKVRHSVRLMRLWGPPGLANWLMSHMDLTARLRKLALEIIEIPSSGSFVPDLFSQFDPQLQFYASSLPCHSPTTPTKRQKVSDSSEEAEACIPLIIGQAKKQLGKFLVDKAKVLNVPPGPLFARLKNGETVVLPDGRVVESAEVCEPSLDGVHYMITHCRSTFETAALMNMINANENLRNHLDKMLSCGGYIFNLGLRLADTFDNIQQIDVTSASDSAIAHPYVAQQALNLSLKDLLPMLHPISTTICKGDHAFLQKYALITAERRNKNEEEVKLDALIREEREKVMAKVPKELQVECAKLVAEYSSEGTVVSHACGQVFKGGDTSISLLGTGAAIPSKFRNVSSTILTAEEGLHILLDCGEGTLSQIYQLYGSEAPKVIEEIRVVFVSHKHGDHINGLPFLLNIRSRCPKPLTIVAPAEMESWLHDNCGSGWSFISCEDCLEWSSLARTESMKVMIKCAYVDHIHNGPPDGSSFGCRLRLNLNSAASASCNPLVADDCETNCSACARSLDIAFSGDMSPCASFNELISEKGLGVLLHEATFEDELVEEAVARRHSTISQCIEAGVRSECELLVLTHFSQRYPSIPAVCKHNLNVAHGLDFLTVPLSSLWLNGKLSEKIKRALELDEEIIRSLRETLKSAAEVI